MMLYETMQGARPLILLLEDDAAAADALSLMLCDWGADVVHGANAGEVLENAGDRADSASMIITDFDLGCPDNGVLHVGKVRKHAPKARVLVMSGALGCEARKEAAGAGFTFLQKPAASAEIIAWLEQR